MYKTLKDIVEGKVVEVPTYDFVTHSRYEHTCTAMSSEPLQPFFCLVSFYINTVRVSRLEEKITFYPADVVLFEGILVFYPQKVRDMFHMKLFVDTDSDVRLSRRGTDIDLYFTCPQVSPQTIIVNIFACPHSPARHEPRPRPGADSLTVHNVCQTGFWGVLPACKYKKLLREASQTSDFFWRDIFLPAPPLDEEVRRRHHSKRSRQHG